MCESECADSFHHTLTHMLAPYPVHPDSSQQSLVALQELWSSCAHSPNEWQDSDKSKKT